MSVEPTELYTPGRVTGVGRRHEDLAAAWLAGYRNDRTRDSYALSLRQWFAFCDGMRFDPLEIKAAHLDLWLREMELAGRADRTISQRITAVSTWYRWLVVQEYLARNPADGVRRPKIERRSPTAWLKRPQIADLIEAARDKSPHAEALIMLLALNGLRIAEACSLDVESLSLRDDYPVLTFVRKGGRVGSATLARPTENAIRRAIDDRLTGPLLLTQAGTRMNQRAAQRIIDQLMPHVRGHHGRITPHALRHSWTTLALEAGVTQDQVRHDGGWADGRMVSYYAHGQDNPLKAATHLVSSLVLST